MDKKEFDMKELDVSRDTETITYTYKSGQSLEAVRTLMQHHAFQWGRMPEFLVVDDVTLAMLKANMFTIMGEEQYFDPANKFDSLMGMTIVNKNNSVMFTQKDIKFVEKETEEDETDEGTDT